MAYRMSRGRLALAALGALFLAGMGFGAAFGSAPPGAVTISNFAFDPATLTVAAGTKVVWTNRDEEPHTITSADKNTPFKSPGLDTDETFAFVFDKPGAYTYFCSIHPYMVGQIIVK